MMYCEFFVAGVPQPKGSTRQVPTARGLRTTSANPKLKAWEKNVADSALAALSLKERTALAGKEKTTACAVSIRFFLPLRAGYRHHTMKPDVDKLTRGILDALGQFYLDDAQVVEVTASKHFSLGPVAVGALVRVRVGLPG
ncbi:MAG: RusA family crossover junction endodeoxyribonuclease [Vicinamibacterales bacterium]